MPLHPQASAYLAQQAALCLKRIDHCTPTEFRQRSVAEALHPAASHGKLIVEMQRADGPAGAIPMRVYRPSSTDPLPALVYLHGGGWVGGTLDTYDGLCCAISAAAECVVFSVDYRLAPEHKFPAAADDAFAVTEWVRQHAGELRIDKQRIAVGGDSAGGNLAAVVSLMARDRCQPLPCLQILIYPILDYDLTRPSYSQYAEGYGLTLAAMQWFWSHYMIRAEDAHHSYASPLRAADFKGLPPTLILTAEFDVLSSEGSAYAERLRVAGVPTQLIRYKGMIHGFLPRLEQFDAAREAVERISQTLKKQFSIPSYSSLRGS